MEFKLSPKQITRLLIFITIGLAFTSLVGQFYIYFLNGKILLGLVQMFNLDAERNIPTIFSALILLLSSVLLEVIALAKQRQKEAYIYQWHGLALIFMYLSFDELLEIHEKVNRKINAIIQSTPGNYWDVFNVIFLVIFILAYLKFFLYLPKKIQNVFFLAFASCVIGGVGIELISVIGFSNIYHQKVFFAEVITTIEESLEILGIIIFIQGIFMYMNSFLGDIHINILGTEKPATRK